MDEGSVLVVEDDPSISKLIVSSLRARGYQADPVGTVADGVKYLHGHRPGLILLDINLPDSPGWSLLDRAAAASTVPPVVVVSVMKPDQEKFSHYHLKACLQKPFSIPALLNVVRDALNGCTKAEH